MVTPGHNHGSNISQHPQNGINLFKNVIATVNPKSHQKTNEYLNKSYFKNYSTRIEIAAWASASALCEIGPTRGQKKRAANFVLNKDSLVLKLVLVLDK